MASDFEAKHFAPGRSRFGFCRTRGRRPVLGCSRGCCSCAAWRRLRYGRATIAPLSLIVLEEVDALAPARGPLTHDHKVEEVVELLRMVESASESGVLFIATTNRKQALDPALLRRGRFDHAIEVGYPSAEEVRAALVEILSERPHTTIEFGSLSTRLAGRPMSDVAWVVNDAAREAARAKKDAIDQEDLLAAAQRLFASGAESLPRLS
jgi:cell division protease FtsH